MVFAGLVVETSPTRKSFLRDLNTERFPAGSMLTGSRWFIHKSSSGLNLESKSDSEIDLKIYSFSKIKCVGGGGEERKKKDALYFLVSTLDMVVCPSNQQPFFS